ncbi:MAG: acyl-CoA dehydrogenase family protein [Alphaproteobacteria bacterium]
MASMIDSRSGMASAGGDRHIAPDCHGANFYDADPAFRILLAHYMAPNLHAHLEPHLRRLGGIAGGRLDELARVADRNEPVLHVRDRFGRDDDWIEYHPAYREMEKIAFEEFGLHAMAHRGGVLGWPKPLGALAKYAVQYLFVQGEFGLMCPISLSDTAAFMVGRYAEPALRDRYLPRMTALTREEMWTGSQFMTEQAGGSDVAHLEVEARLEDGNWRIYGDKWFCSHTDSAVNLILARTGTVTEGSRGLSLFLVPRRLEDGARNRYRIMRLKPKMGTRSMATGEIRFEGAIGYLVGTLGRGLRQTMDQVTLSRLSHGVRAAAMMRRCLNEALAAARGRIAFGKTLDSHPLMRRQLMKIMLPTEQALSAFLLTAATMDRANAGDKAAEKRLRILTPLIKFRACRDNIPVATAAMEVRGGNGFIEDWVNARLVRDAHAGVLWEGTSSIVALDVAGRAVLKERAHEALRDTLKETLAATDGLPGQFRGELGGLIDRAAAFADAVAKKPENESFSRQATNALYHVMTAVLLAHEGALMAVRTGDARRMLLARLVVDRRLRPQDPLSLDGGALERAAGARLLRDDPVSLDEVARILAA